MIDLVTLVYNTIYLSSLFSLSLSLCALIPWLAPVCIVLEIGNACIHYYSTTLLALRRIMINPLGVVGLWESPANEPNGLVTLYDGISATHAALYG